MTRRTFFAALFSATPALASTEEGFGVSGNLTNAGQEGERYYAIDQGIGLMLDSRKYSAQIAGADQLLGQQVRLTLSRA